MLMCLQSDNILFVLVTPLLLTHWEVKVKFANIVCDLLLLLTATQLMIISRQNIFMSSTDSESHQRGAIYSQ